MKLASIMAVVFAMASLMAEQTIRMHSHRGETEFAPQNTVESIKLAYEMGAQMIETDFTLTKYGQMVCVHGRNELKRFWNIDKDPRELTPQDIANAKNTLKRNSGTALYDKKYAGVKLPLIDDVFAAIPKDKRFELEIKGYGDDFADKVDAARKKAGLKEWNILVTSFNAEAIKDFKKKYPKYETLFIVSMGDKRRNWTLEKIIAAAKDANAGQVAIGNYRKIDKDFIAALKKAGFKTGVWQVENLDDLAFAAELGVDRVCSNFAWTLRKKYALIKNLDFK